MRAVVFFLLLVSADVKRHDYPNKAMHPPGRERVAELLRRTSFIACNVLKGRATKRISATGKG
jgi:hypothetical protein